MFQIEMNGLPYRAASNGACSAAAFLISQGANVNACSDDGYLPFHVSAQK